MGKVLKYLLIFSTLFFLVIFFLFLYYNDWLRNWKIDNNLLPLDVFSLLATTYATIWAAWFVGKKISEQRFIKDLLINDLKQIEVEVKQIQDLLIQSKIIDLGQISSRLNILRNSIHKFQESTKIIEIMILRDSNDLDRKFNKLYTLGTNFDGLTSNIIDINTSDINSVCSELIIETRKIASRINKC